MPYETDDPILTRLVLANSEPDSFSDDGWIRGENGELILWIPELYRDNLRISLPGVPVNDTDGMKVLDITDFKFGEEWAQCRDPFP